jgi:REP element-mobilizing transposase RayT
MIRYGVVVRQTEIKFRTWGGKRRRAGRKQTNARKSEPHRKRDEVTQKTPVHITLRVAPDVQRLRKRSVYAVIRGAMQLVLSRTNFRIVHASIQGNHVHLLVEAEHASALAKGMQSFLISLARRLNALTERSGPVFPDRYHASVIDSRRQARHALAYVLNNWRRHDEDRRGEARGWKIDRYSSAVSFRGFSEVVQWTLPEDYEPLPVSSAQSWLLVDGWRMYGTIGMTEVPGKWKSGPR